MPMAKLLRDPVVELQRAAEQEAGPPRLRRIEVALAQRPALPLIALAVVGAGLTLIIVLAVIAGLLSDNFGAGVDSELAARTFRPWFRITLITAAALILVGILTMLLAITVRIWWVTFSNQTFFPVIIDARRVRAGRAARYVKTSQSSATSDGGA